MFMLGRFWRWWTESWRAPGRARWLYGALALGFAGLAIGGGVKGDATVIALGAVFALATAALAVLAPKIARLTQRDERRGSR
jgi:predicted Co/Zn/Cd cation transporter (cation efflux family)